MIYTGHAGYLDDHRETIAKIADRLRGHSRKYDVIVATGLSGVLVASPLSLRLRKPLVVIRKEGENCHAFSPYVNRAALTDSRYLFIDDFISLGDTFDRVRRLCEISPYDGTYAGCYLYNEDVLSWEDDGAIEYRPRSARRQKASVNFGIVVAERAREMSRQMASETRIYDNGTRVFKCCPKKTA